MEINKSSRHPKIVGDLGEQLVCNWLSRSGWEVVPVDHTGIDLIAYHRKSGKRIGITVMSQSIIEQTLS
jgi:Holliday junction resolvase-like predicted endonuclease